ncbi:hypothetical protein [Methylorubrum sp. POS3]|uniref:hypothetical protein n=1 Tax=Methylorubrum sp. POS3 TaxID=2998492 RepID=UPI003729147A
MQAFFSSDGSFVVQFLVIFLIILVLLVGAVLLFRRLSGRGTSLNGGANGRGRQPRLGIVDIYELDRQRQLILLRRDNVEHLLLVGGPNDVVIERHIQRGSGPRFAPEPELAADPTHETARTEKFLDSPAPPAFAMPEVVPPAVPGAEPPHPERSPPLDPGLFEPDVVPPPAPSAPARARPASPVGRLIRRTAPPLAGATPEAASSAAPIIAAPTPTPIPTPEPPPASEPVPETPPVIAGRGPRPVDPAVLSDMARQLQVALKRPSSAVTPPPGAAEAAASPAPVAADAQPNPLAAAMATAQADPLPPAAPTPPPPASANPVAGEGQGAPVPRPDPEVKPEPARATPAVPVPVPVPARPADVAPAPRTVPEPEARPVPPSGSPKPDPSRPEAAAPSAEAPGQSPFSVEEIEAEFARLLGRPLDKKG